MEEQRIRKRVPDDDLTAGTERAKTPAATTLFGRCIGKHDRSLGIGHQSAQAASFIGQGRNQAVAS